jgi:hypothetical protein
LIRNGNYVENKCMLYLIVILKLCGWIKFFFLYQTVLTLKIVPFTTAVRWFQVNCNRYWSSAVSCFTCLLSKHVILSSCFFCKMNQWFPLFCSVTTTRNMDVPYIHNFLLHGLLSHNQVFDLFTYTCIN